jgi:hypothetical protein
MIDWQAEIFLPVHEGTFLFDAKKGLGFVKGTANPVPACTAPEGSRRLRLPDFKTIGGKVVSCTHRRPLLVLTSVRG